MPLQREAWERRSAKDRQIPNHQILLHFDVVCIILPAIICGCPSESDQSTGLLFRTGLDLLSDVSSVQRM